MTELPDRPDEATAVAVMDLMLNALRADPRAAVGLGPTPTLTEAKAAFDRCSQSFPRVKFLVYSAPTIRKGNALLAAIASARQDVVRAASPAGSSGSSPGTPVPVAIQAAPARSRPISFPPPRSAQPTGSIPVEFSFGELHGDAGTLQPMSDGELEPGSEPAIDPSKRSLLNRLFNKTR